MIYNVVLITVKRFSYTYTHTFFSFLFHYDLLWNIEYFTYMVCHFATCLFFKFSQAITQRTGFSMQQLCRIPAKCTHDSSSLSLLKTWWAGSQLVCNEHGTTASEVSLGLSSNSAMNSYGLTQALSSFSLNLFICEKSSSPLTGCEC